MRGTYHTWSSDACISGGAWERSSRTTSLARDVLPNYKPSSLALNSVSMAAAQLRSNRGTEPARVR
jgi:hypothetical protein